MWIDCPMCDGTGQADKADVLHEPVCVTCEGEGGAEDDCGACGGACDREFPCYKCGVSGREDPFARER